jgi:lipid II:glycine glycyltransferase (peptidoglycan interpeptide bridge formation enzyme)
MLVDLSLDEEAMMAKLNKTTRYNIRYSARNGVEIREATEADFDTFYELLVYTGRRGEFSVRSKTYYHEQWKSLEAKAQVKLFLATYNGVVLAARMAASFGEKAATLHSGSFDKHMNLKPNELLMYTCMQWAKSQGCTLYDVWGIPKEVGEHVYKGAPLPQEQKGDLWGVYQFKRGFGGEVVYYVGTFDYIYSSLFYGLMNLALDRLGSFDKLAQVGDSVLDKSGSRRPKL